MTIRTVNGPSGGGGIAAITREMVEEALEGIPVLTDQRGTALNRVNDTTLRAIMPGDDEVDRAADLPLGAV